MIPFLKNPKLISLFWILISKFSFVLMMAIVKHMKDYSPLQLNFLRSFIIFLILFPALTLTQGLSNLKTKQPLFQFIRMLFSASAMVCFFYGYRMLPIGKASAINFSYALVVPAFSCFFLNECVSWRRWAYLIIGYVGILIIINPVFEVFELGEFIALLGVVLLASASILVKRLTNTDKNHVLVFYSSVATSILLGAYFLCSCFLNFGTSMPCWVTIQPKDFYLIGAIVLSSLAGQFSYVEAYRKGQLNFLAGFDYLKFLFASALGYMVFGEIIEDTTFYGALLILICSYLNTKEELRKKNQNDSSQT